MKGHAEFTTVVTPPTVVSNIVLSTYVHYVTPYTY